MTSKASSLSSSQPRRAMRARCTALGIGFACLLNGCNRGPARIYPPAIDASSAAAAAIQEFDRDADQQLSPAELAECPAISNVFARYDKNGDGHVAAGEIETRIGELSRGGQTGLYSVACRVTLDQQPLAGASVELIPEAFLGEAIQPARGVTSRSGLVRPAVESLVVEGGTGPPRGMQPGIYRVAITHEDRTIADRFQSGDALGLEVSESSLGTNIVFALTSD